MFGSLVICLPTEFTGGQLIIRSPNLSTSVTHDWGSTSSDRLGATAASSSSSSNYQLAWAAMYSDCEHEIKPVTTGHRVTLTYNLFTPAASSRSSSQDSGSSAVSASAAVVSTTRESAFGTQLASALSDATWYPEGVTLGLVLEHFYAVETLDDCFADDPDRSYDDIDPSDYNNMPYCIKPENLKGSDLQLYRAARGFVLEVKILPVVSLKRLDKEGLSGIVSPDLLSPSKLALMDSFDADPTAGEMFDPEQDAFVGADAEVKKEAAADGGWADFLLRGIAASCPADITGDLLWVKRPGQQHLKYCGPAQEYEGNNGSTICSYAAAAVLLVTVPPVGSATRQG
jgi:hypothetical protein